METHSTEIGNVDAPQPMDTLDTAFLEANEDMEVIGMSPMAVNSENAGAVTSNNTESETGGVTRTNIDATNEINVTAPATIENISRVTITETTQIEAIPESAQMDTIPELVQMEAVAQASQMDTIPELAQIEAIPELVQMEAIPEPTQMDAIPEQAQMGAAPETAQMEAVFETTQMEPAAESSRTEAQIELAQVEATCESAQMEASAEATRMEAMPESTLMEQTNDNAETFGLSQSNAEPVAAATNSTPSAQMNNEYREILGDIAIPEGVDPAFLAALPDDIRAEVVRDHLRQQRAQRLARPAAATAAVDGSENAGTPGVEPLDEEFLNALPPDLQEEIMAQHERTIRLAVERNEQAGVPPSAAGANDAVALIDSLPPTLRESILADVDDSVLQVLPQNVAAEARRLRGTNDDHSLSNQFMRFTRMLTPSQRFRPSTVRPRSGLSAGGASIGALAGVTSLASKTAVQLMDRDAIVTIVILLFVDPMSLNCQRLQKLIKSLCAHAPTCDFVVWCLLALLDKVNNISNHDEEFIGTVGGWIDHICVTVGGCRNERVLKFFKQSSGVVVHPSVSTTVTRLTLDTLISLAKSYPGHFLPAKLRSNDAFVANGSPILPFDQFWHTVQNIAKADARGIVSLLEKSSDTSSAALVPFKATMASCTLEDSALGQLMLHMDRPIIRSQSQLQDKLLRLVCTVLQTLPDYTVTRMSIDQNAEKPPLAEQLGLIVKVMTEGSCSEDGLADGRILLMEAIRALTPSTKPYIESRIVDAAEILGARLLPHILQLQEELGETISDGECSEIDPNKAARFLPAPAGTLHDRFDASLVVISGGANSRATINASGCQELQLPAMRELTSKKGIQNVFLRALQTVIRMRSGIRNGTDRNGEIQDELMQEVERMSDLLKSLDPLWEVVSKCLRRLVAADIHAALALQPVTEAFFLIYGSSLSLINPDQLMDHADAQKLFHFAETHRHMINQVLRQSNISLTDGPFSILIQMPRLLDFDVKRKYFRKQIDRLDERVRNDGCAVRIRRNHLFSDSFRELYRLQVSDWKSRFCIIFDSEEGQDAGGLLREWFSIITREIFNPNYALFITAPGDRVTYMINKTSYINPEHLDYFKFVGRIIAKAIYENKLLDCYFTRAFYKHILSVPVRAQDLESEDPGFYKSLEFLLNNPIEELGTELTFSLEVEEFGVRTMKELKENGTSMMVTDENKEEYVKLVCQMKMTGSINQQLNAFLDGFYEIIPKHLIAMFNEQELELLISGLPNIDIDDLYANTEYKSYTKTSPQIQWFWKALRTFEHEDRAKFLQFVTGTSKVPLLGFKELEGMNGVQKFSIHMDTCSSDRLPTAHTCFNQLDLPQYDSYDKLRDMLLLAVRECTEGFGFA